MKPIVFYDIPSNMAGNAWSPNTWKTRYCLNYKRLPYTTVWVEFPDIPTLCLHIRAPKTFALPMADHTLPAIFDPNTARVVADSAAIARYLDAAYPSTPRLVSPPASAPLLAAFDAALVGALAPDVLALMVPPIRDGLRPRSAAYFTRSREAHFGVPLEALAPKGSAKRAGHVAALVKTFETVAGWLAAGEGEGRGEGEGEGEERPFFAGDAVSFADVTVAAWLKALRLVLGEDSEVWRAVASVRGGRWARFAAAFEAFEAVDAGTEYVVPDSV
ncbi:uncharacterized protein BXZ73DRAFT_103514 [Epithele typhae]|uniref:uncharacterized protein n=1 Tax=Epithele typhae TaxID=378194 RepID=UPI0020074FCB|nr:uncharacterized protein BXZ73DRAFT_103514 [Epithele typhae]KAH9924674.1 hypothetical protein BXZ73DRAFT_103514 [Epithele typhae]